MSGRSANSLTNQIKTTGGPGPCIYISQEQGGPVIPPSTGFLTGLALGFLLYNVETDQQKNTFQSRIDRNVAP
jgi:hypothetical protein